MRADTFGLELSQDSNKVVELSEAISRYVKDGMAVYVHNAGAAIYELASTQLILHDRQLMPGN